MIVSVNVELPLVSVREVAVEQQAERLYRTSRLMGQILGTG
jgi:hypothetical protein